MKGFTKFIVWTSASVALTCALLIFGLCAGIVGHTVYLALTKWNH